MSAADEEVSSSKRQAVVTAPGTVQKEKNVGNIFFFHSFFT